MPHMLNDEFDDLPPLVDASTRQAFPGAFGAPPTPHSPFAAFPPQFPEVPSYETNDQVHPGSPWPAHNQQAPQLFGPNNGWPAYWQPQVQSPPAAPFLPFSPAPYHYALSPVMIPAQSPPIFLTPSASPFLSPPSTPSSHYSSASMSLTPSQSGQFSPAPSQWALTRSASDSAMSHKKRNKAAYLMTGRPPSSWRTNYDPSKSSLSGLFGRKGVSGGADLGDISRVALHPTIQFNRSPPFTWDLRRPPTTSLQLHQLNRRLHAVDLAQYATNPPLQEMLLVHVCTPWIIHVTSEHAPAVTLHDLFTAIWEDMHRPIRKEDFYNDVLGDAERGRINKAWHERCGDDMQERSSGVRRVDFLCEDYILVGLVPGRRGVWELKTREMQL